MLRICPRESHKERFANGFRRGAKACRLQTKRQGLVNEASKVLSFGGFVVSSLIFQGFALIQADGLFPDGFA